MPQTELPRPSPRSGWAGLCPRCRALARPDRTKYAILQELEARPEESISTLAKQVGGNFRGTKAAVEFLGAAGLARSYRPAGSPQGISFYSLTPDGSKAAVNLRAWGQSEPEASRAAASRSSLFPPG